MIRTDNYILNPINDNNKPSELMCKIYSLL